MNIIPKIINKIPLLFGMLILTACTNPNLSEEVKVPNLSHERVGLGFMSKTSGESFLVDPETGAIYSNLDANYKFRQNVLNNKTIVYNKEGNNFQVQNLKTGKKDNVDLGVKENEFIEVHPSISDESKFFIEIYSGKPTEIGLLMVTAIHYVLYDATEKKLMPIHLTTKSILKNHSCIQYDSSNFRLISWRCGEGVGSQGPLLSIPLDGDTETTLFEEDKELNEVLFDPQSKRFLIFLKESNQLILLDINNPNDLKRINYGNPFPSIYSAQYISDSNKLVIGGSGGIFIGDLVDDQMLNLEEIKIDKAYANLMYIWDNKLYLKPKEEKILTIDLSSKKVVKEVPLPSEYKYVDADGLYWLEDTAIPDDSQSIEVFISKLDPNSKDAGMSVIEDYYGSIARKNYNHAYALSKKTVPIEVFSSWYSKTTKIVLEKADIIDAKTRSIELSLYEGEKVERYKVTLTLKMDGDLPVGIKDSKVELLSKKEWLE